MSTIKSIASLSFHWPSSQLNTELLRIPVDYYSVMQQSVIVNYRWHSELAVISRCWRHLCSWLGNTGIRRFSFYLPLKYVQSSSRTGTRRDTHEYRPLLENEHFVKLLSFRSVIFSVEGLESTRWIFHNNNYSRFNKNR